LVSGRKIEIEDHRSPLQKSSSGAAAIDINGCNFFYGEYDEKPGERCSLSNTQDPEQWDDFWKTCLKQNPPGPLPPGSHAILVAEYHAGKPVAYELEKLTFEDDGIKVLWNRIQLKGEPQGSGRSRYGVLVLPAYGAQKIRETNWRKEFARAAEKVKIREDEIIELSKPFIEGAENRIVLLPTIRYRHRFAFLKI
jgi:hypothetical protein